MVALFLLWIANAPAQEAPTSDPPVPVQAPVPTATDPGASSAVAAPPVVQTPAVDDGSPRVIVVRAQASVVEARDDLIHAAADLGYTWQLRRHGQTVLRNPTNWKGEVHLLDDGQVDFRRAPPIFRPLQDPSAWLPCLALTRIDKCVRVGGWAVGPRKLAAQRRTVLTALDAPTRTLAERMADLASTQRLASLPDRLDALWHDGTPLDTDAPLTTPAARRRALFDFWDSRTEEADGQAVRDVVMRYLRNVVQQDDPYTDEELTTLEAQRRSLHSFVDALRE